MVRLIKNDQLSSVFLAFNTKGMRRTLKGLNVSTSHMLSFMSPLSIVAYRFQSQQYCRCWGPYSQTVKWTGSVHLHSYGLHICLFFPWRCTTRPWRAVKVMLAVQRWNCVRGGRLQGPAWNLQSPHRAWGRWPAPSRGTAEQKRGRGPTGNTLPIGPLCKTTEILFHLDPCVDTSWAKVLQLQAAETLLSQMSWAKNKNCSFSSVLHLLNKGNSIGCLFFFFFSFCLQFPFSYKILYVPWGGCILCVILHLKKPFPPFLLLSIILVCAQVCVGRTLCCTSAIQIQFKWLMLID